MVKSLFLLIVTAATLVMAQVSSDWATITGEVLSADGKPVAGASVTLFPMDVGVSGIMPQQPLTDSQGRYRLSTPAFPGRVRLGAVKESAGYPDTQGLLFASKQDHLPLISLSPGAHLKGVDIRLSPPDGVLEGRVIDADTQLPVVKARITLHKNEPDSMYSTSLQSDGHFVFALPQAAIEIRVVAPGYRPWRYIDPGSGADYLLLKGASDHRLIMVKLVRISEQGTSR